MVASLKILLARGVALALARIMLRSLKLSQFRCFDSLRLDIGPGLTAFIGANAQGKTSILEAVCVLLRLQSPRTVSLNEMIRFEQSGFGLAGTWGGQNLSIVNEVRRRRRLYHGDNELSGSRDYLEHSGLVVQHSRTTLSDTAALHQRRCASRPTEWTIPAAVLSCH